MPNLTPQEVKSLQFGPQKDPVSLGPQYQGMLDANPYRNQSYNKSPWQNFLTALGFRTEADAWQENMAVQAAEYDASIAQKAYDEQYNTASAQAERMRAAGLNPDIDGGSSISPGEAASLGQDPSTPMQATGEESVPQEILSTAFSVATGCLDAVATATGIVQSVQGIRRNHLDNVMQSISNEAGLQSLADQVLPYLIPTTNSDLFDEDGNVVGNWQENAYQMAKFFTGDMPKKLRGKFQRALLNRINSAPGERKAYEEWSGRIRARKDTYRESANFYSEEDDVLRIVSEGLEEMNMKLYKQIQNTDFAQAEATEEEAKNDKTYYSNLDSALQAGAENKANEVSKKNNEMVSTMRDSLKGIVDELDKASKESGIKGGLASVAMALISTIQLWISSQGAPSVSRSTSSSSSFNPRTGVSSQSSKSSFGLNL